jgi:hypothetical protein
MRLAVELLIAAALVALGWEKPLSERAGELPWFTHETSKAESHSQSSTLHPRPTATVSGSWMWDPNRKTTLDRPSPTPRPREYR